MNKVLIYDASDRSSIAGLSWPVFAGVFTKQFNRIAAVRTVEQCLDEVEDAAYDNVQIWAHGLPGKVYINGEPILVDKFPPGRGGTIWFRTCSSIGGPIGKARAWRLAMRGWNVAGHTDQIGLLHGGLVGVRRNQRPWWDDITKRHWSKVRERHILPWSMRLPEWTWAKAD